MRLSRTLLIAAALLAGCKKAPAPPPPDAPSGPRDVFLFLGDSLTAGFGVPADAAYPSLLETYWKAAGVPYRMRNAGVSGATTAGILENLDWSLAPDVHTVFLCIGANDALRGLDLNKSQANIETIIQRAKAKGIRVVLAGMRLPPNYGDDYANRFAAIYPEIAKKERVTFMPFLLQDVGGRPNLNLEDGIHPNVEGHKKIAENVQRFFNEENILR